MNLKKRLYVFFVNISKKSTFIRYVLKLVLLCLGYIVYEITKKIHSIDDKMVLFNCFLGRSYACSPKALYEYMLKDPAYKEYSFVWVFRDVKAHDYLSKNRNTILVDASSYEYEKYLAKAKYLILNWRLPDHVYPKKNQIFLQCWHGTPLKKLGYDIEINGEDAMNSIKEIRFKYKMDSIKLNYLISPSKFASEKFISAFNLKAVHKENKVIEKGYPRNDFLFNFTSEDIKKIKEKLGILNPQGKKILLYAPTWRGNQHTSGLGYTYENTIDFEKLMEKLSKDYIILFRTHYLVANTIQFEKFSGFVYDVSKLDDINELYVISDLMITDYSSVFFDFANLKRPILFYMYDLEFYRDKMRGFYFSLDELPGPIIQTEGELIDVLEKGVQLDAQKFDGFNKKYNYLEDGKASMRVLEEIIEK